MEEEILPKILSDYMNQKYQKPQVLELMEVYKKMGPRLQAEKGKSADSLKYRISSCQHLMLSIVSLKKVQK